MANSLTLFKRTFEEWREDKASRLAAALAYYTVFSLAPLLIVVIAVVGLIFGEAAVRGQLFAQIQGVAGPEAATLIENMVANVGQGNTDIIATVIGIVTLLLGAMGVFLQLQDSLNTVWEVTPASDRPLSSIVTDRIPAFAMLLGIGFLLLVSLVLSAALSALGQYFGDVLPVPELVLQLLNFVLSFGIITLLFGMMYKVLPDAEITWRDVWIGAAMTALLFVIGKFLVGLYIGRSGVGSAYGAAGSLVIVLVWIYYSAQLLLFGAEFTQVYASMYGSQIVPEEDAVAVERVIPSEHDGEPRSDPEVV